MILFGYVRYFGHKSMLYPGEQDKTLIEFRAVQKNNLVK